MKNYYQVLGINSDASSNEIKKAYRSLTLKHHPDKNNNSQDSLDKTQELNDAYSILGDPEKRKSYDYKLKLGISDDEVHMDEFNDINNLFSTLFKNINENTSPSFNNLFQGMAGMSNMSNMSNIPDIGFMGMPNIKIFHGPPPTNFNNFSQNPFQSFMQPDTIEIEHTISFYDSYVGCKAAITYDRWIIVNTRKINEQKTLNIDIEAGIFNNEIIILEKIGNIIDKDNIGNLEIKIIINNDTKFERKENDIIFKKELTFKESLCGFTFILDHISGKSYAINNNNDETLSLIYNGYQKVIPNLGFKRKNIVGNLIIHFSVKYPEKLNKTQIEKIREII
tara:strand:- start:97 stop:1107 length:1011 start_codon:yes stop_codon:yes gene_type:complete